MFPPVGPTTITTTLPAYLYQQYTNDENLQALVAAYNRILQDYVDWFVNIGLPDYTGPLIVGPLLDWVAQGLYGMARPALSFGEVRGAGLINTFLVNELMVNEFFQSGNIGQFVITDDIFKRILTWHIFKGDGPQFTIPWFKRRIMRFLTGVNGTNPPIDNFYPVSIDFTGNRQVTITVTLGFAAVINLAIAQIFQAAILSGVLSTPFQYTFLVDITTFDPTGLTNVAGTLGVTNTAGWSTSSLGLAPGQVWVNSGIANVIPGITPNPFATPVFFGLITAPQLLVLGGGNLPTSNPGVGSLQLWNNANVVSIA